MAVKMKEELKWQAEEDARTLARAEEIKSNKTRLNRALKIVQEKIKEQEKVLQTVKKVKKTSKNNKRNTKKPSKTKGTISRKKRKK